MSPDLLCRIILIALCVYAVGTVVFVAAIWHKRDPSLKGLEIDC